MNRWHGNQLSTCEGSGFPTVLHFVLFVVKSFHLTAARWMLVWYLGCADLELVLVGVV